MSSYAAAALQQPITEVCYAGITFKEANFNSLLCSLQDFTQRPRLVLCAARFDFSAHRLDKSREEGKGAYA